MKAQSQNWDNKDQKQGDTRFLDLMAFTSTSGGDAGFDNDEEPGVYIQEPGIGFGSQEEMSCTGLNDNETSSGMGDQVRTIDPALLTNGNASVSSNPSPFMFPIGYVNDTGSVMSDEGIANLNTVPSPSWTLRSSGSQDLVGPTVIPDSHQANGPLPEMEFRDNSHPEDLVEEPDIITSCEASGVGTESSFSHKATSQIDETAGLGPDIGETKEDEHSTRGQREGSPFSFRKIFAESHTGPELHSVRFEEWPLRHISQGPAASFMRAMVIYYPKGGVENPSSRTYPDGKVIRTRSGDGQGGRHSCQGPSSAKRRRMD